MPIHLAFFDADPGVALLEFLVGLAIFLILVESVGLFGETPAPRENLGCFLIRVFALPQAPTVIAAADGEWGRGQKKLPIK